MRASVCGMRRFDEVAIGRAPGLRHGCAGPRPGRAPVARDWGRIALALAAIFGVSGCATVRGAPAPPVDAVAQSQALAPLHGPAAIMGCLSSTTEAERRTCRDTIVEARMIAVDARYTEFRQAFYGEARWGRFAATVASLGLTSAASLSGMAAAQALSAAATGVTGVRAAYDREVLTDKTANAIESAMDSARDAVGLRLRRGLQQSAAEYPLAIALSDLEAYYNAGTLLGALADITRLVGAEAQQIQAALRTATYGPRPSGERIRRWLYVAGMLDRDRARRLSEWVNGDSVLRGTVPYESLIDANDPDPRLEAARARAIAALGIP